MEKRKVNREQLTVNSEQGTEYNGNNWKRIFLSLLFLICYLVLGCNKTTAPNHIRVVLDWTPNTNHTGLYVALDNGWFAEEGLTVEIIQPPEDGALVLLASGNAQFGFDFQEWMGPAIANDRDALPVTAVAAIISHNTSGIMSLRESGIQRPADLAGKRFGSWEMPVVTEIIRDIVENDGGDFNSVIMLPNWATDALSALQTDLDAIWVYYAWDVIAAVVNGIEINFLDLGSIDSRFDFYTPVLVANTNWLSSNGETARKFMQAVSRGYTFAIENPFAAGEILLKYAPELDRELVMQSQFVLAPRYQDNAPRWGEIDPERWGNFYRWMYEQGLLEVNIGEGGFTNEYLP
ncbi:MAG: ABC transporter substrate-binding protein [Treponema sp.]|nr:ABC transporter substrate-binding protein [Treponema sp.]